MFPSHRFLLSERLEEAGSSEAQVSELLSRAGRELKHEDHKTRPRLNSGYFEDGYLRHVIHSNPTWRPKHPLSENFSPFSFVTEQEMQLSEETQDCTPDLSGHLGVGFVAVHVGAGFHSSSHESEYKEACRAACTKAMKAVKRGLSAKEVVTFAISTLEDFSCTNAGIGSNLTRSGTLECDACIMDGQSSAFGAVGALKGMRNPIQVACKLLDEELKGPSASGLVPPIFLAGKGAFDWAMEHGFDACHDKDLITDRSFQTWQKCKRRLQSAVDSHKPCQLENLCNLSNENENMDTVGAVCMDTSGHLCAGASSGGVVYKMPGRIGQAAVYGSGCWATSHDVDQVGVACCTSGCGEHLIKTLLAKECANLALTRDAVGAVQEGLGDKFLGSTLLSSVKQKLGGVLLLRVERGEGNYDCTVDLVWGHTTDSMCIGYMAEQDKKPKVRLSRLQSGQQLPLLVEGTVYRLPHR